MHPVENHTEEMEKDISSLEESIASVKRVRDNSSYISEGWFNRTRKVERIQERGWRVHPHGEFVSDADRKALEALLTVAHKNLETYKSRTKQAALLIQEMESRVSDLRSARAQLSAHSLLVSSDQTDGAGDFNLKQLQEILDSSRKSAYKARAFIEIEAGAK